MATISHMLAANAAARPDDTALIELRPSLGRRTERSWRQFDEQANRIANALSGLGIGKGDRVLHLMMNSAAWLEAYFGIIRTGAWAVPLSFRFTGEEIGYCAAISGARACILGGEFIQRIQTIRPGLETVSHYLLAGDAPSQDMPSLGEAAAASSPTPPPAALDGDEVCGLYFTSGTTGEPKPIVLTHRNMELAAETERRHHFQQPEDNFVLLPPLYHTGAKMHWFGSLISGSRATILTEFSPRNVFDAVSRERGSIVWLLVPWAQDILGALDRGELCPDDHDLSSWRLMHIGAQPVPPSLVRRWKARFPRMQYDTNYGLSEATGPGCIHLGIENEHKVGAIGRAGDGWQVRIVSDAGNDVRQGENGEIIVRGDGVMREYFRNPGRTAEAIRGGWLYTGDIGRMDEDGFIWLTDRKKDVIITGGENIYPVEVEDAIQAHPKVYDVAVIGIPEERLGEVVAAIVSPQPGQELTREEIDALCERNLPRHKRPRRIIFGQVPRSPTGKIEKPGLRRRWVRELDGVPQADGPEERTHQPEVS